VATRGIEDDIRHLIRSLKRSSEFRLLVRPAKCHTCGFVFSVEHLHKPGKCSRCRETWIAEPLVEEVERK